MQVVLAAVAQEGLVWVLGAGQLSAGGRAPAPPWVGDFLDGSLGRGRSGHKQVFQAFQSCQGGAFAIPGWRPVLMQKLQGDARCCPPPICIGVCEDYLLQAVRSSRGLFEMVEPSSCPAAIGWDWCA